MIEKEDIICKKNKQKYYICLYNILSMEVVFKKDAKNKRFKFSCPSFLLNNESNFYYFVFVCFLAFLFFFVMLINNNFTLNYSGDYSAQYTPMFYHVWDVYHEFFDTGHFRLFDNSVYIGASTLGADTYYGLFSPFNLILIIFPRNWVPQVSALISIFKCALGAYIFNVYLQKSFKTKVFFSRFGGIAYAFCGWTAFYLWYGNYIDMMVFFPLVLLGIEEVLQHKKPWILAVGVFFLSICNYVLMTSLLLCAVIYAVFRYFQLFKTRKSFKEHLLVLGLGIGGALTGLLISSIIVVPAIMNTLSSPKLGTNEYLTVLKEALKNKNYAKFFSAIFSWNVAPDQHGNIYPWRWALPIVDFFFPTTSCRNSGLLETYTWDFDDNACSLWCYTPLLIFFIPAVINSFKENKVSHILALSFFVIILFTPFMYFFLSLFTAAYARWSIFVCSSFITYIIIYLNKYPNINNKHIHFGYAFVALGIILSGVLVYYLVNKYSAASGSRWLVLRFRLAYYDGYELDKDYTWLALLIQFVYTTIIYLVALFIFNKKGFKTFLLSVLSLEVLAVGTFLTYGHGYSTSYNNGTSENHKLHSIITNMKKSDNGNYKVFTSLNDGWSDNNGLMNDYSGLSTFHSLYNFNIRPFLIWSGLANNFSTKAVAQVYRAKNQESEDLLGVKYYIIQKDRYEDVNGVALPTNSSIQELFDNSSKYQYNVPLNYELNEELSTDEYVVYENKRFISLGMSYDYYSFVDYENTSNFSSSYNSLRYVYNSQILKHTSVFENKNEQLFDSYPDLTRRNSYAYVNLNQLDRNTIRYYKVEDGYLGITYPLDKAVNLDTKTNYINNLGSNDPTQYIGFIDVPSDLEDSDGLSIYTTVSMNDSCKYRFYFIDDENKIFMYDNHDDYHTASNDLRGFYFKNTKEHKLKKIMFVGRYSRSYEKPVFYYQLGSDYKSDYDIYYDNGINFDSYSNDKITFKTDYDKNKIIVTKIPFDKGWKLYREDTNSHKKQIETFVGNGGFVSFICEEGEYSYTFIYETPYSNIASYLSAFGTSIFLLSLIYYQFDKEKKYRDNLLKLI